MNRFRNALDIQFACNPSGIAHAIVEAFSEMSREGTHDTADKCADPAVRLMTYQLAYLMGVTSGAQDFAKGNYHDTQNECVEMAKSLEAGVPGSALACPLNERAS